MWYDLTYLLPACTSWVADANYRRDAMAQVSLPENSRAGRDRYRVTETPGSAGNHRPSGPMHVVSNSQMVHTVLICTQFWYPSPPSNHGWPPCSNRLALIQLCGACGLCKGRNDVFLQHGTSHTLSSTRLVQCTPDIHTI
mmetsp:Transcript_126498/g.219201  ORF Transcript_126498/g.219201 Transcript_126498/m.219201 type:complete len:140 (-) Transcript_126498:199-618(-)